MSKKFRGPIAWMTNNGVAANIFLMLLIVGGFIQLMSLKQEVFPKFDLDIISVTVKYSGASPKEVESGIILPIEEAVRGIDGVKRLNTTASEGMGIATLELILNAEVDQVLDDVKSAISQIKSFPKDAEDPNIKRLSPKSEVISLIVYGNTSHNELRQLAERARDELLMHNNITLVDIIGAKDREIAVEVPSSHLIAHKLTLDTIAKKIAASSVEIPAGKLKTPHENMVLRANNKLEYADEYKDVILKSSNSGEKLTLSDIASIKDTFEDNDIHAQYNGYPALMVRVFRTGEQKPTEIASTVKDYKETFEKSLPPGLKAEVWNDFSKLLKDRIDLLTKNALLGLVLVFIILGLFLEPRLAFWVTMGIPASFLGSFLLLPFFDVSINMISLFAFIVTLGMVVDDAIVVGENIYTHKKNGYSSKNAAILGTKQIATPVIFAILTTMAAFSPLFFVPGIIGKFFYVIPVIVVIVLLMSLFESLFILPNHLAHSASMENDKGILKKIGQKQKQFSHAFMDGVTKYYKPIAIKAVTHRYLTLSISISILILVIGLIGGGRLMFSFMPKMDSDIVLLNAELDVNSPIHKSKALQKDLLDAAQKSLKKLGGTDKALGFYSQVGRPIVPSGPVPLDLHAGGAHIVNVMVYLVSTEERNFSSTQFQNLWQKELGDVAGLKSLSFKSTTGPSAGKPVSVRLMHRDTEVLKEAAKKVAAHLKTFSGLTSIEDGISKGKRQVEFSLKDNAYHLDITPRELGNQIRHAFYGAEAKRSQRDRDEISVMVRLPKEERNSVYDIENFKIQTKSGEALVSEVAHVIKGSSYSRIKREDSKRVITVSADIIEGVANANQVMSDINKSFIPTLLKETPGLRIGQDGEQREQSETLKNLGLGFLLSLLLIYALIAIPLKSYLQPLIIMSAIPFGIVGAAVGHMVMGFNLSIISMFGLVALSGIVVNDSLVFIHAANHNVGLGKDIKHAIVDAGIQRFRPILLTSLTTFFGLMPMILETSLQARFLIPMAISIGFGVMFATAIILVLVPALFVIVHDISMLKLFATNEKEKKDLAPAA